MPRVHTAIKSGRGKERKCARCHVPIEKGESYFSWTFFRSGTVYHCYRHPPKPSELTRSKMSEVYAAQEQADETLGGATDIEDITQAVHEVGEVARNVADEYTEAAEPFGGEGEHAERAQELEPWADELENFEPDVDEEASAEDQLEAAREQAQELLNGCPL